MYASSLLCDAQLSTPILLHTKTLSERTCCSLHHIRNATSIANSKCICIGNSLPNGARPSVSPANRREPVSPAVTVDPMLTVPMSQ